MIHGDHNHMVDWWGLGNLLYELLHGRSAFWEKNQKTTVANILHREPLYSKHISSECCDIIGRFLEKRPNRRLGSLGVAEIKAHPWFRGIDWEAIARGEPLPQKYRAMYLSRPKQLRNKRDVSPGAGVEIVDKEWAFSLFASGKESQEQAQAEEVHMEALADIATRDCDESKYIPGFDYVAPALLQSMNDYDPISTLSSSMTNVEWTYSCSIDSQ